MDDLIFISNCLLLAIAILLLLVWVRLSKVITTIALFGNHNAGILTRSTST